MEGRLPDAGFYLADLKTLAMVHSIKVADYKGR